MATGTKLMKEISDQFLICKICLEPFKEPKTLSCLHTFCCGCVQQQYDAENNRPTRYTLYTRTVTCPLCRKKTDLPTGGVRRLPDNFLVSNLTEVLAKRCLTKIPPCEICHMVRPRTNDACSKCLDCDKLLCRACVELHSTTKVTQDHSLIDVEGQKDIECKVHPEETVRFYCEKCEECICVVCTFQEHKDHDVCSFNDGFAKHKVALESLLSKSKARLTDMGKRLQVIEKYENLSKELKERIRDLAISYTSQVRAREKELIQQVDQLMSGEVSQLAENKAWLQETFDNLQSACNLTEIVMKDKGVEMLLLKKEIQGKMDHFLGGTLPPEPPDLQNLDVKFVPGEVKLGDVFVPGSVEEVKKGHDVVGKCLTNGVSRGDVKSSTSLPNGEIGKDSCKRCEACADRKRKEAEEERTNRRQKVRDGEQKVTRSVYIQTRPQERPVSDGGEFRNVYFTTTASQVSAPPSGVTVSQNSMHTHTATVCWRDAGTDSRYGITNNVNGTTIHQQHGNRAKGTMTERQDLRTLKTQTDESCLRDTHLGQAAATGSTYPNTGAAIAAAFLRQKASEEDSLTTSWPCRPQALQHCHQVSIDTQDAEMVTDISLGVSINPAETLAALRGESGGIRGADNSRPDLLAQTGSAAGTASPSSVKIRSRKVQTEISSLSDTADKTEEKWVTENERRLSLCLAPGSACCPRPPVCRATTVTVPSQTPREPARSTCGAKRDACVMTPFNVKLVPETLDKGTSSEAVASNSVGMMTSQETRTVYIQTRGPRVVSTAAGTDFEGQMSKSTSTLCVESIDAETAMPQVTQESRMTWTEAVATSERATSTGCSSTSDAATLTSQVQTSDFAVQMRPHGVAACTSTSGPKVVSHQSQTCPSVSTKATMPDPLLATPTPPPSPSPNTLSPQSLPKTAKSAVCPVRPLSMSNMPVVSPGLPAVSRTDRATETIATKSTTRAVGPNVHMQSTRTTGTDTLNLLQVMDKETGTPTVKTVDDWTHTPQPQMISTGVTPPRPAVREVGVATLPITLMDQATYTEVKTCRELGTETCTIVCDSETLTERAVMCDAQTEVEVNREHEGTTMGAAEPREGGCMTEQLGEDPPPIGSKEVKDNESQCQGPVLVNKEVNTTRQRRRAKEVQTRYSYTECLLCQHPDKLEQLGMAKTFTDTSTDPSPPDTHDVATMALSCLASHSGLTHSEVQTTTATLYDRGVATSMEFDEETTTRPFLGFESQDAATSTESLPYIGLLSEIDVDELIVIPEANFELVSDFDDCHVPMVDGETLTEILDYAEVGTQTLQPVAVGDAEQSPTEIRHEEDFTKPVASIGVNTWPKVTFEKETSTPAHNLFSKGTMTLYVTKMDKATSTVSYARCKADAESGKMGDGRVVKEPGRQKRVDDKITMTNRTEQRDIATETDPALVDGRITKCISKLRNVSERLNSPTTRRNTENETAREQSPTAPKQNDLGLVAPVLATKPPASPKFPPKERCSLQSTDSTTEEHQRHRQAHSLLVDAGVVLRPKDPSPVRKAQPITTLKPRTPVTPGDMSGYTSNSLPRQGSLDRQNKVKMGSQITPPSRLPLLRYNSAPGRIATVPTQTLLRKSGATSPRTSPSKIPIATGGSVIAGNPPPVGSIMPCDSAPDPDSVSTSSSQKVQQRPSLPSITETRTPSSCSDSSFLSLESGECSLNVASTMMPSHSRTPSNVTSVSDTPSDTMKANSSADTASADVECEGDDSSMSSTSTALAATPTQAVSSSTESLGKPKKKGFMKRLLSVKKKKKDSSEKDITTTKQDADPNKTPQQQQRMLQQTPPPPSPQVQKKQPKQQGATSQPLQKPSTTVSSSQHADVPKSSSHVSTLASSRPPSTDQSAHSATQGGDPRIPGSPSLPPHHYPPLPDPSKSPPAPKKPRPFVYVRQRIFSIQQDNVEEVKEKKEKEEKEKVPDTAVSSQSGPQKHDCVIPSQTGHQKTECVVSDQTGHQKTECVVSDQTGPHKNDCVVN